MKNPVRLAPLLIVILFVPSAFGNVPQDGTEKIKRLIEQLGEDEIDAREKATEELIAIGEKAKEELARAAQSNDPEVKSRAERILRVIEIKAKVEFSKKLLAWYPGIYEHLAKARDAGEIYEIFSRVTAWDEEKGSPLHEVEDDDVVGLVKLMSEKGYQGMGWMEKWTVASTCRGGYHGISGQINGVPYEVGGRWRSALSGAAPFLIPLLKDNDQSGYVRAGAVSALGAMGAKEPIPQIVPLLKDDNWYLRANAVSALASLKAKECVPQIVLLLKDPDGHVRVNAISALMDLQANECVVDIVNLLKDRETYVRGYSAIALVELGAKDRVPKEVIEDVKSILRWGGSVTRRAESALKALEVSQEEIEKAKER